VLDFFSESKKFFPVMENTVHALRTAFLTMAGALKAGTLFPFTKLKEIKPMERQTDKQMHLLKISDPNNITYLYPPETNCLGFIIDKYML
jgi:hypothetical protein